MLLSLDISTSCTGYSLFTEYGDLLYSSYIDLNKAMKDKITYGDGRQEFDTLRVKAEVVTKTITDKVRTADYEIDNIVIEAPLKSSNNVNTVLLLARFNTMVSMMLYDAFTVCPYFITVNDWRKYAFPGVHCHKGDDKKQVYFDQVLKIYPDIPIEYNRNNNIDKRMYDLTDSIGVGLGWMAQNGKSGKSIA